MMKASYCKYVLEFKRPSGTSRGVLTHKETYFIIIEDRNKRGIGECGLLKGLSIDDVVGYEQRLEEVCDDISIGLEVLLDRLTEYPSIQFGLEQAFKSLRSEDPFILFDSNFIQGNAHIPINGLIWMGQESFLYDQLETKIADGFKCIKMKVGALDFDKEIEFIDQLRRKYSPTQIELRLDANGAFSGEDAIEKLNRLAAFGIHSIEQPIAKGQWEVMAELCRDSSIDIALDEELNGIFDVTEKAKILQTIKPKYIILKPSLVGGFKGSQEWIDLADELGIGWWVTSALESNIGLNAIAQWTYSLGTEMYQGLGTGSLYVNNIQSPLKIDKGKLTHDPSLQWPENIINDLCI